jgi:hypothetical protein
MLIYYCMVNDMIMGYMMMSKYITFSSTTIRLASRTVVNRWAIIIVVRPFINDDNAACTIASFSLSNADVASSSNKNWGFFIIARAIAIRCF